MEWIEVTEEGRSAIWEADCKNFHYEIVEVNQSDDSLTKGYAVIRFPPEEEIESTDERFGYISNRGDWIGKTVIGVLLSNTEPLPHVCIFSNTEEAKEVAEEDLTCLFI